MPHKRSKAALKRRQFRFMLILERRKILREAFYDRLKAELVALKDYFLTNVKRGEVILAPRYVNPCMVD